ncbi:hypothetical protein [Clostridium butyricum]|uniref:hypothetical protein n=1 Tax=Clostridium butyricum TaxID=1492 RepID=UPI00374F7A4E
MTDNNKSNKYLSAKETMKRSKYSPSISVIGATGSGKSSLIYSLINSSIAGSISCGIGDTNQTTIIPCNFMFDLRIKSNEECAINLVKKIFDKKAVHVRVLENLSELFVSNGMDTEETIESIDDRWFEKILEPDEASYHLGYIKDIINIDDFKNAVSKVLNVIENAEPDIIERAKENKKLYGQQKVSIKELRRIAFEELWNQNASDSDGNENMACDYNIWLDNIGKIISAKLEDLLKAFKSDDEIYEMSIDNKDSRSVLKELFDPFQPYSLIVDEITLACRPRAEFIKEINEKDIIRFRLRDTMGLTQSGIDNLSINSALDIALSSSPDSILFLISLDERDDVITDTCNAIAEKILKEGKTNIPVNIIFTKADRIIGNIINKSAENNFQLTQNDYDKNIAGAVEKVEKTIEKYCEKIKNTSSKWLSLRYIDKNIDPIQTALHNTNNKEKVVNFTPSGLYLYINEIIKETQKMILPKDIEDPLFVTVHNYNNPAIEIKVDFEKIPGILNALQYRLTKDKSIVNGYTINSKYRLSPRSVSCYWAKLKRGIGHTTNASVYGNFSINMKGMLSSILHKYIQEIDNLYSTGAVSTITDNLCDNELQKIIERFDPEGKYKKEALVGINPSILESLSDKAIQDQIVYYVFKSYFKEPYGYYRIIDKVAYNLSYGNEIIKEKLVDEYNSYYDYDISMRKLQEKFKEIFESDEFREILADELGKGMTELVNKMIIVE